MQFSRDQRTLAIRALHEAEEHTSGYYCIPPHRWNSLPYDLLTQRDREWNPLPESVLAETRHVRHELPSVGRQHDFYRIQLNDPTILRAVARDSLETQFYPFLVYILTHEMVHLVRLSSILDPDRLTRLQRAAEEARVDRISRQILHSSAPARFSPLLDRVVSSCRDVGCQ